MHVRSLVICAVLAVLTFTGCSNPGVNTAELEAAKARAEAAKAEVERVKAEAEVARLKSELEKAKVSEQPGHSPPLPPPVTNVIETSALYREYNDNPIDFKAKYSGKVITVSGYISKIFPLISGDGVAVHFPDGLKESAVVAIFHNVNALSGFKVGDAIKLQGTLDEQMLAVRDVYLKDCSIAP